MLTKILKELGPSRSSLVVEELQKLGINSDAARQRISRATPPIRKFPVPLLPKNEAFVYLQDDRGTEEFWTNFQRDMRETKSIYGMALDSLIAHGGIIPRDRFGTISGATITPRKGQVSADSVLKCLVAAGMVEELNTGEYGPCVRIRESQLGYADYSGFFGRQKAELILLDAVREWARRIGMASYNSIQIRGDEKLKPVGPYAFDLAGPCYLLPVKSKTSQPGFFVCDVIAEGILDEHSIAYFIRKAEATQSMIGSGIVAMLFAEGYTGKAKTVGSAAGIIMATHRNLFGSTVANTIATLLKVLKNAAAHAAADPEKLEKLLDSLTEIEGSAGNLRGILFELIAAHLIRRDAASIDMGLIARDMKTGKTADIDVLKITSQASECVCIECKGKSPGGEVSLKEVEDWLQRIPTFQTHIRNNQSLREASLSFELWTSGSFHPEALIKLESEQKKRKKSPIAWKNGNDLLELSKKYKIKPITNALNSHFLKHPLSGIS